MIDLETYTRILKDVEEGNKLAIEELEEEFKLCKAKASELRSKIAAISKERANLKNRIWQLKRSSWNVEDLEELFQLYYKSYEGVPIGRIIFSRKSNFKSTLFFAIPIKFPCGFDTKKYGLDGEKLNLLNTPVKETFFRSQGLNEFRFMEMREHTNKEKRHLFSVRSYRVFTSTFPSKITPYLNHIKDYPDDSIPKRLAYCTASSRMGTRWVNQSEIEHFAEHYVVTGEFLKYADVFGLRFLKPE